jgi:mRNA interferase RelE/StbE
MLGKRLSGPLGDYWCYQIRDDWRVVVEFHDSAMVILVLRIGHRREIYKRAKI